MHKHVLLFIVILLVPQLLYADKITTSHGIATYGQVKYPANFKHFDYVNPNAPKGGKVKQSARGTFNTNNKYTLKGISAAGLGYLHESLLTSSADEPFSYYGLVAKSIQYPASRSWAIFNIRPQAKWHDGKPITADDVVFSHKILTTKGHPAYKNAYKDIINVAKLGRLQVKFTFAKNAGRELPITAGSMPILPKHYYDGRQFDKTTLDIPLGSGPYKVKQLDAGKSITYERVKNYWGANLPVNIGRNNFDILQYDYYLDDTVALEALKGGNFDIRLENVSKNWATAYNVPAVDEGRLIKYEVQHALPTGMQAFVFNIRRNKFKDVRVRKALNYAFDFEWLNKKIFYGAYKRTDSYFSNSIFASSGVPKGAELGALREVCNVPPPLPPNAQPPKWSGGAIPPILQMVGDCHSGVFNKPFTLPTSDASGRDRSNLLIARNLLTNAGYEIKDFKLVGPNGKPLEITFLIYSPSFERVIGPYIKNLKKLGVKANIKKVDVAQYQKLVEQFDYDIVVNVFGSGMSPGTEQRNYWHSSSADIEGSGNLIGLSNPVIDKLVDKVIASDSLEQLKANTKALDRVLLWGYYVIPNWYINSFRVAHWDKFAKPAKPPKYSFGFDTWWVKDRSE